MKFPSITTINKSGIILQKKIGQNFLVDKDIASSIVDIADIYENDIVIEIGSGMGALTCFLVETRAKVISFEIDSKLVSFLSHNGMQNERLTILNADFLKADISDFVLEERKCVLIGNIPYSITNDILFKLLKNLKFIKKALLVIQKEVAEKITASPCSKEYGALSVLFNAYTFTKKKFVIPAKLFYPPPKVDSTLIEILPSKRQWESRKEVFFRRLVHESFSQRRKKLYNNLKKILIENSLNPEKVKKEALNQKIDLDKRAEQLSCEVFYVISDIIDKLSK